LVVLLPLLLVAWTALPPSSAAAFGTIGTGGQNREHERITRAALACAGDGGAEPNCFAPRTMAYLAGHDREFGAVGAPDNDELSNPAAHCDNADFLVGKYPRVRDEATASLVDCVNQMRARFDESVDSAQGLLDDQDQVIAGEVNPDPECNPREEAETRAKCAALEGLGRVLHGAQDFYAHSNWADEADPTRPVGDANPPGLNLPGPSPVLDLRAATAPRMPTDLTTGCFVLKDEVPGVAACASRVTHAALNKDRGLIDPATGRATGPTTPRGEVGDNFSKAVAGAVVETRRQWQDLQAELRDRYGTVRGERIICALSHDDPVNDCRDAGRGRVVGVLLIAAVVVAAAAAIILLVRRRGRAA
jgi:hypothetical protein